MKSLILFGFTFWCVIGDSSLELRPSFSYLSFHSSLLENGSPIQIEGSKMYILAKKCTFVIKLDFGSPEYIFLEKDLHSHNSLTYQKRNYNVKLPLLLDGLVAHAITIVDGELKYVAATNTETNELYVLNIGFKYTVRYFT